LTDTAKDRTAITAKIFIFIAKMDSRSSAMAGQTLTLAFQQGTEKFFGEFFEEWLAARV
jgi:hypothetical protein